MAKGKLIDLTNNVFERLTVLKRSENNKNNQAKWICLCECGNLTVATSYNLTSNKKRSCGCLLKEITTERNTKHKLSRTIEYRIWGSMINRCTDENTQSYSRYGGRGIHVCDRWRNDFAKFLEDMGQRPSPQHSIDRIDVNGDYEPSNCRWATQSEQSNNRRTNRIITAFGETKTMKEWSIDERCLVSYKTLKSRISIYRWDAERAITGNRTKKKSAK